MNDDEFEKLVRRVIFLVQPEIERAQVGIGERVRSLDAALFQYKAQADALSARIDGVREDLRTLMLALIARGEK